MGQHEFITERKKKRKTAYGGYWYPGFAFASDAGEGGGDGGGESKPPKALFNPKPMKKGEGDSPDDYEYTDYIPRGQDKATKWAIDRDVRNQKLKPKKPAELKTGFYKNYLGNRPIREGNEELSSEVKKFVDWACSKLHIKSKPKILLSFDSEEAQQNHHTGSHTIGDDKIWVYAKNRNLVDILRTVFHELVHVRQGELNMIKAGDSYPGSPIEAMADMLAGKYIKIYAKQNRNIFQ